MAKRAVYPIVENTIGKTPLVRLATLPGGENEKRHNTILAKLEGNNPSGSLKDRTMTAMVSGAEARGELHPGDTLIEATNGNAGIALAMIAARKGYRCRLVMPEDTPMEKQQCMAIYGAEIVLTPRQSGMAFSRRLAGKMAAEGEGIMLDPCANPDNPRAHYETTAPEIWDATRGRVTHVVCGMGTTGTIMGISQYLKEKNPAVRVIGVEPEAPGSIPGLRKWPASGLPPFYDNDRVDRIEAVSRAYAEQMARRLAREEGLFWGLSSAASCHVTLRLSREVTDAVIVFIAGDRGERYLSTGAFPA